MGMDITSILDDTDFNTDLTIIRKTFTVDSYGNNIIVEEKELTFKAVVVPSLNTKRNVVPEYEYQEGRLVIYTREIMYALGRKENTTITDFFSWSGNDYQVMQVKSFSGFNFNLVYADLVTTGGTDGSTNYL